MQGGPLVHVIAAKAVCFKAGNDDEFRVYIRQVVKNAKALLRESHRGISHRVRWHRYASVSGGRFFQGN
jgi:glycine/serine hydroxymethyltransferase